MSCSPDARPHADERLNLKLRPGGPRQVFAGKARAAGDRFDPLLPVAVGVHGTVGFGRDVICGGLRVYGPHPCRDRREPKDCAEDLGSFVIRWSLIQEIALGGSRSVY